MTTNPGHQPERFTNYLMLDGGRGFHLKTGYIFKINRLGGFYDEYGNYYDSLGKPATDPSNGEPTDDENSIYS